MNTIFMSLVLAAGCFLSGCGLAAYALRHFNSVKLGVNIECALPTGDFSQKFSTELSA